MMVFFGEDDMGRGAPPKAKIKDYADFVYYTDCPNVICANLRNL